MASTPPGADAKMPAVVGAAATTSCPRDCALSRPSRIWPCIFWTKVPPLMSSVALGNSPKSSPLYVAAATEGLNEIMMQSRKIALPVTSAFVAVDLMPVASQEILPVEMLDEAELK